ncbi:tRNA pseudouridine55 synthase [Alkalispirochaeta americana]|uniref:tRNA pseudouridine synthase B n=1 Tax=Alkalispirochaeta americana TaxID=159291 RepID=A0A1N6P8F4_9SPIO|nr:tRNA pseudouridine(55) synthase TruB [Alkalispirochaeta americana]SIQ00615.1 tRNA pseudouridine55 synthase [Alkalispirochaeta americana]
MTSGILLLNKPPGISSARVLGPLKRCFSPGKIGHTGTLDPFASGLLVVLVGSGTRLSKWFTALDKQYTAILRFGEETDTLDPEGSVVATAPIPKESEVRAVLDSFVGTIEQVPPAYSAIHIDGKRAYERARKGEVVEIPSRSVTVTDLSIDPLDPDAGRYRLHVSCTSGTYIRSLARDVGRAAGSVASLESLERSAVGAFSLDNAQGRQEILDAPDPGAFLLSVPEAFPLLPGTRTMTVPESLEDPLRVGTPLSRPVMNPLVGELQDLGLDDAPVLLVSSRGRELALCEKDQGRWTYRVVFPA